MPVSLSSEYWRARAQEFRDLAAQIMFPPTKAEFLRLAKEYERRATHAEEHHAPGRRGEKRPPDVIGAAVVAASAPTTDTSVSSAPGPLQKGVYS
jgi:hypothetical protein